MDQHRQVPEHLQQSDYKMEHIHKSHNAHVSYPTAYHSGQTLGSQWCIVGYGTGGICKIGPPFV